MESRILHERSLHPFGYTGNSLRMSLCITITISSHYSSPLVLPANCSDSDVDSATSFSVPETASRLTGTVATGLEPGLDQGNGWFCQITPTARSKSAPGGNGQSRTMPVPKSPLAATTCPWLPRASVQAMPPNRKSGQDFMSLMAHPISSESKSSLCTHLTRQRRRSDGSDEV